MKDKLKEKQKKQEAFNKSKTELNEIIKNAKAKHKIVAEELREIKNIITADIKKEKEKQVEIKKTQQAELFNIALMSFKIERCFNNFIEGKENRTNLTKEQFFKCIQLGLNTREALVFMLKNGKEDYTYSDIGRMMNVTRERVRQVLSSTEKKLQMYLTYQKWVDYLLENSPLK